MSSQASLDQIQELYIAYYGRPADAAGLSYWASALASNGGNLSSIINAFATSPESTALYGSATTTSSIVTAIYENVLHRAPDAAGLAYYSNALTTGALTAGNLALAVTNGVQNADVTTVQNEVTAANQFTVQATTYSGATAAAVARTFLAQVSADPTAETTLLTSLTSYINATSAATTAPTQFAGDISGGVLTNPAIVANYASGTTPTPPATTTTGGSSGSGSSSGGGSSGGSSGGGGSSGPTSVSGTIASMFDSNQHVVSTITNGITVTVTDGASVAQIQAIETADTTGTITYPLLDTMANLDNPANSAIVAGASSYIISDIGIGAVLTVAQAGILTHANNYIGGANIYSVTDTAAAILSGNAGVLSGATAVALSANATVSVANADALAALHGFGLNGQTLSLIDTVGDLTGHATDSGATSYIVQDLASAILSDSSGVVSGAASVNMVAGSSATSGTLTTNAGIAVNITGANNLTLTLAAPSAETINASAFTGTLNLTDSGFGDTISTGSGTTTIKESSTANADNITLLSGHTAVNTLVLSTQNIATDIVNNFVLNQDVIKSGTPLTVGSELSAASGIVASGNYASASLFIAAAEATTGVAGDTIAWVDQANNNTYVAAFNGSTTGSAHIVELVGVQATAVGGAGSGHVLIA